MNDQTLFIIAAVCFSAAIIGFFILRRLMAQAQRERHLQSELPADLRQIIAFCDDLRKELRRSDSVSESYGAAEVTVKICVGMFLDQAQRTASGALACVSKSPEAASIEGHYARATMGNAISLLSLFDDKGNCFLPKAAKGPTNAVLQDVVGGLHQQVLRAVRELEVSCRQFNADGDLHRVALEAKALLHGVEAGKYFPADMPVAALRRLSLQLKRYDDLAAKLAKSCDLTLKR